MCEQFRKGVAADQKRILGAVGSNLTLTNRIFRMQAKIPFEMIASFLAEDSADSREIEPEKSGLATSWNAVLLPYSFIRCREDIEDRTLPEAAQLSTSRAQKRRRKKITPSSMRRLVKEVLRFFREHPGYDLGTLPQTASKHLKREAA